MKQPYHISNSEWLVLQCLWDESPLEIKDIHNRLQKRTGWNSNMIRTLVVRLQEKGAISAEKQTRIYRYYPLANKQSCIMAEMQEFLDRIFDGSPSKMITTLIYSGCLSRDELNNIVRRLAPANK